MSGQAEPRRGTGGLGQCPDWAAAAGPAPGGRAWLGVPAEAAWRHLLAGRVVDRARAVRALAAYPRRWDLRVADVIAILDRYPVLAWDQATSERFLRLVGEITPGGLPAVLAAMPDEHWVTADAPLAASRRDRAHETQTDAALDHRHHDRQAVRDGAATALLILTAQGLITGRNPATSAGTTPDQGSRPRKGG